MSHRPSARRGRWVVLAFEASACRHPSSRPGEGTRRGRLGFEGPCNRTERAVERTAPLALVSYSLTVLWYVLHGQRSRAARLPTMPWYTHKAGVTFSDMLATLRRASWSRRLFDPASSPRELRKRLQPWWTTWPAPHDVPSP